MKLSVVTICRNDREGLSRTLESTFERQPGFSDWEQVVVDGASTDGSADLLLRWKNDPRMGFCVSEPDSGIYNAMNKGLSRARGDYLLFLNAGDCLLPDVLEKVFAEEVDADVIYGDMFVARRNGRPRLVRYPAEVAVTPAYFLFGSLPHQASFIARNLFERFGGYSEELKIGSDSKFFLDCARSGAVRFKHLGFPISTFARGGLSTDPHKLEFGLEERVAWLSPAFGAYAARKATFPPPPWWAGESVVRTSIRDHDFGRLLWAANRLALLCWRIPPIRFLFRILVRGAARIGRLFHR